LIARALALFIVLGLIVGAGLGVLIFSALHAPTP